MKIANRLLPVYFALFVAFDVNAAQEEFEDPDITFLYTGDLKDFVEEAKPHVPIFVEGGTLIDGTGRAAATNPGILIQNGRFAELGTSEIPENATRISADGKWVTPGLIDLHAHITYFVPTGWNVEDDVMNGVRAERFLEKYQAIGVTTVADVGSRFNVGYSLKRAQRMRLIGGSRLYVSGPVITTPAGHATEFIPYEKPVYAAVATGPWEFRKRVREAVMYGADFIKVTPRYTVEELKAVVEEANDWNIFVTAHVGGLPDRPLVSGHAAAATGVHSVQHLYPYGPDRESILRDMARQGIYVVPTIGYHLRELAGNAHVKGNWMEINQGHTHENMLSLFESMQTAGLKFGVGTDSNPMDMLKIDDIYAQELEGLALGGLSPMRILQAATQHAAEALQRGDEIGSIETAKKADLIIVSDNPLKNLRALVHPEVVIQDGRVVHERD